MHTVSCVGKELVMSKQGAPLQSEARDRKDF